MGRVFYGLALISSIMVCSSAFAGDAPNSDPGGSKEVQKPSSRHLVKGILLKPIGGSQKGNLMSRGHYHCPRRQPMRLNILAACRFRQFPNQRRFRAIRGQGFTLGSVLGLVQLQP